MSEEKLTSKELLNQLTAKHYDLSLIHIFRELKNVIENMVIVSNNEYLQTEDLPWAAKGKSSQKRTLIHEIAERDLTLAEASSELEKQILLKVKETCGSTREMAMKLEVNQSTIVRKLQKYHIE